MKSLKKLFSPAPQKKKRQYLITKEDYLTEHEQKLLIERLSDDRDSILIKLALCTGARLSEILNMKFSDITNDSIYIHGIKGSHDREIPLKPSLVMEIYRLRSTSEYIFNIKKRRAQQVWESIRPVKKKFHSLRHTFAVNLYSKTKDILVVKNALGHVSIENTLVYTKVLAQDEVLRKALL